jgi:hypothetical protein
VLSLWQCHVDSHMELGGHILCYNNGTAHIQAKMATYCCLGHVSQLSLFFLVELGYKDDIRVFQSCLSPVHEPGNLSRYCDWATSCTTRVRFLAGIRDFSLLHSAQTGSGSHVAFYTISAWGCLLGVKRPVLLLTTHF